MTIAKLKNAPESLEDDDLTKTMKCVYTIKHFNQARI